MPYNLLLLPLWRISIYPFNALFPFCRPSMDGYRFLFQAAIAGVALSILARLAELLAGSTPLGLVLGRYWPIFSPFPYSATSALSLLLGPARALMVNLFLDKEKAKDKEIRREETGFLS